jgi:predicted dehydrogenase
MAADVVRLGLVGVGRWGRNYLRTIAGLDGVQLAAVASRNPNTAALVLPDCRVENEWQALIAAKDVDAIIVVTPPATHAAIVVAALQAAKPVLVEKPLAQSRADAQLIRSSLGDGTAIVMVDHIHLFHPAFRALQREAAVLGPIRSINSAAGNRGPYRPDVPTLWDWAPHDLAMLLTLVPGPAVPKGAVRLDAQPVEGATAERIAVELELAGGIPVRFQISTLDERHRWFAVAFDSCTLVFRDRGPDKLVRFAPQADIHSGGGMPIAVSDELPLTRAVRDFIRSVRDRDFDRTSIELGLTIVDLIEEIEVLLGAQDGQLATNA